MSEIFQLVYRSEIKAKSKPMIVSNISDILEEARKRNSREGITGMLIYYDQTFFQILEGEKSAVENIYLITHEPQPISAGGRAWAVFGRWPRSGGGSWLRDRSAC